MRGSHHPELPVEPPATFYFGVKGSLSEYLLLDEDDRPSFSNLLMSFSFISPIKHGVVFACSPVMVVVDLGDFC